MFTCCPKCLYHGLGTNFADHKDDEFNWYCIMCGWESPPQKVNELEE